MTSTLSQMEGNLMKKIDVLVEEGSHFENPDVKTNNSSDEVLPEAGSFDDCNVLDMDLDDDTVLFDPLLYEESKETAGQIVEDNSPAQSLLDAAPLQNGPDSVTDTKCPSPEIIVEPTPLKSDGSPEIIFVPVIVEVDTPEVIVDPATIKPDTSPEIIIDPIPLKVDSCPEIIFEHSPKYASDLPLKVTADSSLDVNPSPPKKDNFNSTPELLPESGKAVESSENEAKSCVTINPVPGTSSKPETKLEIDYVSTDPKENADNFDSRWETLRSLSENDDKYSLIRRRWGNARCPNPGIDLTYRHRNRPENSTNQQRGRQMKRSKMRKKRRSLSCVSHLQKLMEDVKNNYYCECQELCKRHASQLWKLSEDHHTELISLVQIPLQNFYAGIPDFGHILDRQRQDKETVIEQFRRGMQELVSRTSSNLARRQKDSDEMILFHKQYTNDGSNSLTDEQYILLEETERMYNEYQKFYG
ncbi:UNVERIFIED_CONTAM: hypothetical protein PYX00_003799 [Menopon gallinae]|uniref:Uncharacterized protein n=1 Tax=Menopon gallinae TaxID=328185 RepID=A0AAW2I1E7_9NEOP